jgi:hypothetical protein
MVSSVLRQRAQWNETLVAHPHAEKANHAEKALTLDTERVGGSKI